MIKFKWSVEKIVVENNKNKGKNRSTNKNKNINNHYPELVLYKNKNMKIKSTWACSHIGAWTFSISSLSSMTADIRDWRMSGKFLRERERDKCGWRGVIVGEKE